MGTITFKTIFSGGDGRLIISCNDPDIDLNFTEDDQGPKDLTLAKGHQILSVKGSAPDGDGGNIALAVTGDIPAEIDQNFGSGDIPTHSIILFVTS